MNQYRLVVGKETSTSVLEINRNSNVIIVNELF